MKRHFARRQSKAHTRACRDAELGPKRLPVEELPASSHPDVEEEVAQNDPAMESAPQPAAPPKPPAIVSVDGQDVDAEHDKAA